MSQSVDMDPGVTEMREFSGPNCRAGSVSTLRGVTENRDAQHGVRREGFAKASEGIPRAGAEQSEKVTE